MAWSKTGYSLHRQELKQVAHARRKHYRCETCGASYLRYQPHSKRCQAGLCEVCYEERKYALLCKCPRIRGDESSVYACALCPEMDPTRRDPEATTRLVRAVWDEFNLKERKKRERSAPLSQPIMEVHDAQTA